MKKKCGDTQSARLKCFLQNHGVNLKQTWHNASLVDGDSSFFFFSNEEPISSHKVYNGFSSSLNQRYYIIICVD